MEFLFAEPVRVCEPESGRCRVHGFFHHLQGGEGVKRGGGAGPFVSEQLHDDRQRDPLLVEGHGLGLADQVAVQLAGNRWAGRVP